MDDIISFQNEVIPPEGLPQVKKIIYQKVERSYLNASIIGTIIFGLILLLGWIGFYFAAEDAPVFIKTLIPILFVVFFCLALISSIQGFKYMGYAIRQQDIVFKKGWLWKSNTMIPFNRVQHCEVNQNPIERLFGLASLKVFTAGGASSDLSIAGLTPAKAEQLKLFITTQTTHDEEE